MSLAMPRVFCADFFGQRALRGQEVMMPLVEEGLISAGICILNVEAGCASGTTAFLGAIADVLSGQTDIALAVGVEKMNDSTRPRGAILEWMEGTGGVLEPDFFYAPHRKMAAELGVAFNPGEPGRSVAMDMYAIFAQAHMKAYGTTPAHLAAAAAKNHTTAVDNPRAQYRFPMTVEEVLADRIVVPPLTRAMCAPTGDAAGAVIVCSREYLRSQPASVRARALPVLGHAACGGQRERFCIVAAGALNR